MQSIPLAVLKPNLINLPDVQYENCMQSIPLAVLKLAGVETSECTVRIACNPYRLRY